MTAGKRLHIWSIEAGISVKEIARRIGVEPLSVSRYIHGKRRPLADQRIGIERMVAALPQEMVRALPVELWSEDGHAT